MNRRGFLTILGGVVASTAAKPLYAVVPVAKPVVVEEFLSLDQINAFAFMLHGEAYPEHRDHYRQRALGCLRRAQQRRIA